MLMLHHAQEVLRADLDTIPTPPPTSTWRPLPHAAVVATLLERAAVRGLRVRTERYALTDGALYPQPGVRTVLKGARLFASLDFGPVPGLVMPPGCLPSAGLRNSHDKTFALSILSGARVVVCANGVLSAEHIISRKHTCRVDLGTEIDRALDAFVVSLEGFRALHDRLQNHRLTTTKAHSLVVELARAGAIPSASILPVVQEYEEPQHEEFRGRNAWSLYNAATECMKSQSPARQADGFKALNEVLLPLVN